jgi:phosphatidylinositol alpha-1,6-mannosyltransferase
MKVLYLAPQREAPESLTAYSFIDEEIRGIAARGLDVYLPIYSLPEKPGESERTRIHLFPLPSGLAFKELVGTLQFLWQVRRLIPAVSWLRPFRLYHSLRWERFTALLAQSKGIDVIHSNFGFPNGFGGILARAVSSKPLVTTVRGMDVLLDHELDYGLRRDAGYDAALRTLLRNADYVTGVSEFIRQQAIALGAHAAYSRAVLKGVDYENFKPNEELPATQKDRPMILTVGGLITRKGIHTILEALGQLINSNQFDFVVVGKGAELANLKDQSERLALQKATQFEGSVPRSRIADYFRRCDIFVLGSKLEGAGNVLLEAMASARPVICTNSGGPPEYVVDGNTGFVVGTSNPQEMADRIKTLLDDPALRLRFGKNGRERAIERFGYDRMVNDILDIYRSAIARRERDSN